MLYKDKQKDKKILMEIIISNAAEYHNHILPGLCPEKYFRKPKCATNNGRIDCDVIVYIFAH